MNLVERTEPITLDEVMEFVDSIDMDGVDKHQLKCMIADIAYHNEPPNIIADAEGIAKALRCGVNLVDLYAEDCRFQHVRLSNGNAALFDTKKRRMYHSYMNEGFMKKIGLTYKVVDDE